MDVNKALLKCVVISILYTVCDQKDLLDVDLVEGCFSIVIQAGVEFDSLKLIHIIYWRAPTPTTLVLILIFSTKIFMNCCIVEL